MDITLAGGAAFPHFDRLVVLGQWIIILGFIAQLTVGVSRLFRGAAPEILPALVKTALAWWAITSLPMIGSGAFKYGAMLAEAIAGEEQMRGFQQAIEGILMAIYQDGVDISDVFSVEFWLGLASTICIAFAYVSKYIVLEILWPLYLGLVVLSGTFSISLATLPGLRTAQSWILTLLEAVSWPMIFQILLGVVAAVTDQQVVTIEQMAAGQIDFVPMLEGLATLCAVSFLTVMTPILAARLMRGEGASAAMSFVAAKAASMVSGVTARAAVAAIATPARAGANAWRGRRSGGDRGGRGALPRRDINGSAGGPRGPLPPAAVPRSGAGSSAAMRPAAPTHQPPADRQPGWRQDGNDVAAPPHSPQDKDAPGVDTQARRSKPVQSPAPPHKAATPLGPSAPGAPGHDAPSSAQTAKRERAPATPANDNSPRTVSASTIAGERSGEPASPGATQARAPGAKPTVDPERASTIAAPGAPPRRPYEGADEAPPPPALTGASAPEAHAHVAAHGDPDQSRPGGHGESTHRPASVAGGPGAPQSQRGAAPAPDRSVTAARSSSSHPLASPLPHAASGAGQPTAPHAQERAQAQRSQLDWGAPERATERRATPGGEAPPQGRFYNIKGSTKAATAAIIAAKKAGDLQRVQQIRGIVKAHPVTDPSSAGKATRRALIRKAIDRLDEPGRGPDDG